MGAVSGGKQGPASSLLGGCLYRPAAPLHQEDVRKPPRSLLAVSQPRLPAHAPAHPHPRRVDQAGWDRYRNCVVSEFVIDQVQAGSASRPAARRDMAKAPCTAQPAHGIDSDELWGAVSHYASTQLPVARSRLCTVHLETCGFGAVCWKPSRGPCLPTNHFLPTLHWHSAGTNTWILSMTLRKGLLTAPIPQAGKLRHGRATVLQRDYNQTEIRAHSPCPPGSNHWPTDGFTGTRSSCSSLNELPPCDIHV